jgi:hypothetical protein
VEGGVLRVPGPPFGQLLHGPGALAGLGPPAQFAVGLLTLGTTPLCEVVGAEGPVEVLEVGVLGVWVAEGMFVEEGTSGVEGAEVVVVGLLFGRQLARCVAEVILLGRRRRGPFHSISNINIILESLPISSNPSSIPAADLAPTDAWSLSHELRTAKQGT